MSSSCCPIPSILSKETYGLASARRWRFVDLGRRLDFLLAGFGWCRMPEHLIAQSKAAGALTAIDVVDDPTPRDGLTIYAAHKRHRALGRAGRWLLDELRRHLPAQIPAA